jgi:hypothetical protein
LASAVVNASWDSFDDRFRVSGSSLASDSLYRLDLGTGISFVSLSASPLGYWQADQAVQWLMHDQAGRA